MKAGFALCGKQIFAVNMPTTAPAVSFSTEKHDMDGDQLRQSQFLTW
jgi:hypothetical protein